jgi:hypothetical protein
MATVHGHASLQRAGFVALAASVVAFAAAGRGLASSRATVGATACKAGVRKLNGVPARTFCGPATARVLAGATTFVFTGGNCVTTAKYVSVNIGTVVLGQTTHRQPNYFGLDIGRIPGSSSPPAGKDGTYRSGTVLTIEFAGKSYDVLTGVAVLKGHRTRGTVKGKTFSGRALTGTFHC